MFVVAAAAAAVVVVLVVVVVAVVAPISKECAYAYMPVCIYTCMYVHVHPCYNEDALCHAAYDQAKTPSRDTGAPKPVAKLEGLTQLWRAHRSKPNMTNCSCVNVTTS